MNEHLYRDIHHLLEQIVLKQESGNTELQASEEPIQENQEQPQRRINVYIELEEEEDVSSIIESTFDELSTAATTRDSFDAQHLYAEQVSNNPSTEFPVGRHSCTQRKNRVSLLLGAFALVGVALQIACAAILPLLTPSATVMMVTTASWQTTTSTIQIVSGTANPAKYQVAGRILPSITMSQAGSVSTTGTTHRDAKAAQGNITFYNAAPYTQTVKARTLLTGADGIQVVTDQDAIIPAAVMPTEGRVTVVAHAASTGHMGNIQASDIYGQCCLLNVFTRNGPFHGGIDAREYQTATLQDIDRVVDRLKASLDRDTQTALQTQVQPAETLVVPLLCRQKVTPNHQPGEEATQVNVTLDETCTGAVYNTQVLTNLATQIATQVAAKRLGTGYASSGIQTSVSQATSNNHDRSELQIKTISSWTHSFTQNQQQVIKAMIAGTSKGKATVTLLHMAGIQNVFITLKNGTTIPQDVQRINLIFLKL